MRVQERNAFKKVHQETFGKSGSRRITPGQFLATDPKGRACLIAAVEKQKFVYVLNRDAAANLTISSPLEAHKGHTLVFAVTGLDMGFDNPVFAAIELDYADADQVGWALVTCACDIHFWLYLQGLSSPTAVLCLTVISCTCRPACGRHPCVTSRQLCLERGSASRHATAMCSGPHR